MALPFIKMYMYASIHNDMHNINIYNSSYLACINIIIFTISLFAGIYTHADVHTTQDQSWCIICSQAWL